MKSDTELAAELRRLADPMGWGKGFPELPTFAEAADRIEALAAERDATVARAAELEAVVRKAAQACQRCRGTGHVHRYEYDSASDEMEWAGMGPCRSDVCRAAAELLAGKGGAP